MTAAVTSSHPFTPDAVGEPGYRVRCRVCGAERHSAVPKPRKATR